MNIDTIGVIFSFLNKKEIRQCSYVCREFMNARKIINKSYGVNPMLVKYLRNKNIILYNFGVDGIKYSMIIPLSFTNIDMRYIQWLYKIQFNNNKKISNEGMKYLNRIKKITINSKITNNGMKHLNPTSLTMFDSNYRLTNNGLKHMKLKKLFCAHSHLSSDVLKYNTHLKELDISGCFIDESQFNHKLNLNKLIFVGDSNIPLESFGTNMVNMITSFPITYPYENLIELHLMNVCIDNCSFILPKCTSMTLNHCHGKINSKTFKGIPLEYLYIIGNIIIHKDSIKSVSNTLKHLRFHVFEEICIDDLVMLERLDIFSNDLCNDSFRKLNKIKSLTLIDTANVSDKIFTYLSNLRELTLINVPIYNFEKTSLSILDIRYDVYDKTEQIILTHTLTSLFTHQYLNFKTINHISENVEFLKLNSYSFDNVCMFPKLTVLFLTDCRIDFEKINSLSLTDLVSNYCCMKNIHLLKNITNLTIRDSCFEEAELNRLTPSCLTLSKSEITDLGINNSRLKNLYVYNCPFLDGDFIHHSIINKIEYNSVNRNFIKNIKRLNT